MNIFALHSSPKITAQWHVDKHVVKMILETTQLLTNCYYKSCELVGSEQTEEEIIEDVFTGFPRERPYKPTHMNHPCTLWAADCKENWEWLLRLGQELCQEYTFRYGKQHACSPLLQWMSHHHPVLPESLTGSTTPFVCVMPDKYKLTESPIRNYRLYYTFGKTEIHSWKDREIPFFINSYRTVYNVV